MRIGTLLATVLMVGCGSAEPPVAGSSLGFVPDLRGRRVMVFPVQNQLGVPGDATSEIDFVLRTEGEGVEWILPTSAAALVHRPVKPGATRTLCNRRLVRPLRGHGMSIIYIEFA